MQGFLIFAILMAYCDGARILAIVPFPGRSHWIVMEPLLQELAARGHQVTVYTPYPQKKPLANYTDHDLSAQIPTMISKWSIEFIKTAVGGPFGNVFFGHNLHESTCKVVQEAALQNLNKSKEKYDLLITEVYATDCFAYFATKLNTPMMSFTTSTVMPWSAERMGLPDNPSYIPNYMVSLSPNMNLWEKIYNTVVLLNSKFWHYYVFYRQTRALSEETFGESLPPLDQVVANTSLLLVNSHYSLAQSRPFPPNVIEVGGIHIKKRQPLPESIKALLDEAKEGAIIMSFGSIVRSSTIPKSIIKMFLNVFAKFPQKVFFKFEEELPDAPPNVIVREWLPQRDMVEHENVVALIAHGGLASTIEAVYFNKPIIGIPFFADQHNNIESIVSRGVGVQLDLDNISEVKITAALSKILHDPRYKENMKRLSLQFRDRPMTPLQTAVYWTEYVIRHQGAPHLRPASVGMPFYQYLLLDVIAVLLASITAALCVLYVIVKWAVNVIVTRQAKTCEIVNNTKKID